MTETEAYAALARALQSICPADFSQAALSVEMEDDWTDKRYQYKVGDTWSLGQAVDANLDFEADDALHALRAMMRVEGKPAWTHCTFTLNPDGTFNFDVSYGSPAA
ncbi:MAG: hypothetical protein AAFX45_07145 [Pseudomonadota bacterium]